MRVRVHAAGLNFADLLMVAGQYQEKPSLPFIPGGEFAGIITEVGEDVLRSRVFRVGQAVAGVVTGGGAMADEAVIPTRSPGCLPVPDGMTLEQAAAFPVAYGTSHVALVHRANVGPGDRVLVLGAAGGVGLAAVQIAKARGAAVVAVATGAEKMAACRAAGADHCLDASALVSDDTRAGSNPDLGPTPTPNARPYAGLKSAVARAFGDDRGVDALFDPVGDDAFAEGFRAVRWGGHALVIGFACGKIPKLPLNLALVKNVTVHGVYWGAHATRSPRRSRGVSGTWRARRPRGDWTCRCRTRFRWSARGRRSRRWRRERWWGRWWSPRERGDGRARAGAGPGGADCDGARVMFRVRLDGPYVGDMFQFTRPNVNHTACDTS